MALIFFLALIFAVLGGWIATQKYRSVAEGVILGFFFGPLGAIIEALLPTGKERSAARGPSRSYGALSREASADRDWLGSLGEKKELNPDEQFLRELQDGNSDAPL